MSTHKNPLLKRLCGAIVNSYLVGWVLKLPPLAWIIRQIIQRELQKSASTAVAKPFTRPVGTDLESTLNAIVYDVVESLGYTAAMVATLERGDILVVRAFYIRPEIATKDQIRQWEIQVSVLTNRPLSLTNPEVARVERYNPIYRENLSVLAAEAGQPIIRDDLYCLLTPIVPPTARPALQLIQEALQIRQVIAVPFFVNGNELVGNLFVAKNDLIAPNDKITLSAFARQAAAVIESESRDFQNHIVQDLVYDLQANLQSEAKMLQRIVKGVVEDLGFVGAMVATYEADGSLPVRGVYVNPSIATEAQLQEWEAKVSRLSPIPLSLTDPDIARVYRYKPEYKANLSVQAAEANRPVDSDELYSLLTPIVPVAAKSIIDEVQRQWRICKVIAVPFFAIAMVDGVETRELVGNLFAITRSRAFSLAEKEFLEVFGQQAAVGIRNARLYRRSEEHREVARRFATMAFSSAASVHELRGHIGVAKLTMDMLPQPPHDDPDGEMITRAKKRLSEATRLLDNLREPWRQIPDTPVDINVCLGHAEHKVDPTQFEVTVQKNLDEFLPAVYTSKEMLSEAFRVIVKNAVEAFADQDGKVKRLFIQTCQEDDHTIHIIFRDNACGIKLEHMTRIFEMGWSNKASMGFGLFWAKDYIEGLGGRIEVESIWQEGTTFHVYLPTHNQLVV